MLLTPIIKHIFPRLRIQNKERVIVPFKLNPSQDLALRKIAEHESRKRPIRFIVDKARQVGMSTMIEGIMVAHAAIYPSAHDLIVAHQADPAKTLFDKAVMMWRGLPMRPRTDPTQRRLIFPHKSGDSFIDRATAGSVSGRSKTINALHLSEAAFFPSEQGLLSLLPTVPDNDPASFIAIESTANGKVDEGKEFYDLWIAAIEGRSDFIPIFIAWWQDPEYIRAAEEVPPIDSSEYDAEEKELIIELAKNQGFPEKAIREKLAWRRWAIINKSQGYIERFHQEYPSNWEESFIASGDPAFTAEEIRLARDTVIEPVAQGRIDVSGDSFTIRPISNGSLRIYRDPAPGHEYYLGADAARGTQEGDFSAAVIWDGTTGEQCVTYADRISAAPFASIIKKLGTYYNEAMVNIELTGGYGTHVLDVLRNECGYYNFYGWRGKKDDMRPVRPHKICWETTWYSRERMFTAFREALRLGVVTVRCPLLAEQIANAVRAEGRFEIEMDHDDIMMAALIAWIAYVDYPPVGSTYGRPDQNMGLEEHWRKMQRRDQDYVMGQPDRLFVEYDRMVTRMTQGMDATPLDRLKGT